MRIDEFHYRVLGRIAGARPGAHAGRFEGDGTALRSHQPLGQGADVRRLDLRASAREPFSRLLVRRYSQPASLLACALVDASASVARDAERLSTAARFVASLGYSAYRTGDAFAAYAATDTTLDTLATAPTRAKVAGARFAEALHTYAAGRSRSTAGASAMPALTRWLPQRPALVFVVSDFFWPDALLDSLLAALGRHSVVPVQLAGSAPLTGLPRLGLARVADVETGAQRTLWMRPRLRARLAAAAEAFDRRLGARLAAHGLRALRLRPNFPIDDVNRYFVG